MVLGNEKMKNFNLRRRLFAEFVGTACLVATVIGSGIMGERLAGGNDAIALLGNTAATGAILVVLIIVLGPVSGAHLNPAVTIALSVQRIFPTKEIFWYILAQIVGGILGTIVAHFMFEEAIFSISTNPRTGISQWFAEFIAAFGLVITILGCLRVSPSSIPYAVGLFITAGYWFTSSTSFANPAVAIARSLTDTFSGINPAHVPIFIVAEVVGALAAAMVVSWLFKSDQASPKNTS